MLQTYRGLPKTSFKITLPLTMKVLDVYTLVEKKINVVLGL